jgi:hypothetical protein
MVLRGSFFFEKIMVKALFKAASRLGKKNFA